MSEEQSNLDVILQKIQSISRPHGLEAEWQEGAMSVGVGGDNRTYTPVIVLTGEFPGHDLLAQISSEISNRTPINRITFEIGRKK